MREDDYLFKMRLVFSEHYLSRHDVWSRDRGLRISPRILHRGLTGPASVIDIGCGRGTDCEFLLSKGHMTEGLDIYCHPHWRLVRQRYKERARFTACDFLSYSTDRLYEAALDNGCFHHQDPETQDVYLNKIRSLLKADGLLCLNVYTPGTESAEGIVGQMKDGRFARAFNADQLEKVLSRNGFISEFHRRVRSSMHDGTYLIALARKR